MSISSSIVVATRNRPDDIIHFLNSVKKQTVKPREIIIIDSSDKPLYKYPIFLENFSSKKFSKIRLIYKHTAPGSAYQRNEGIKVASSELTYFFDDDAILNKDYLEKMNLIFEKNPQYAAGMGDIENISKNKQSLSLFLRKIFMLQRIYSSGKFTWSGMPTHPYGTKKFKNIEVLSTCLMGCRTKILKNNLFDEILTGYAYMEDCDLARRISYKFPVFYLPDAKIKHIASPISRDKIEENRAMFIKNYSYLFFKNFYPKNKLKILAYIWSITGLFVEAIVYRNKAYLKGYVKGLKNYYFSK